DCSTATVTITINSVNDVPVAVNDVNTTNEDTPVNGTAQTNDTPSGDGGNVWTLVGVNGGAAHGTVTMNPDGSYTYTPDANYNGTDVFTYQVCDVTPDCSTATVTITINSVNDVPVAVNDVNTTNEDTPVNGTAQTNDTPSGDGGNVWTLVGVNGGAAHGTVTMNPDGSYTYTPDANYNGTDVFTYQVCDVTPDCSTATVTITIDPVDDLPTANADLATTNENVPVTISVLVNDDFGGDGPSVGSINLVSPASHGNVTLNDGGTPTDPTDDQWIYTPNSGYSGTDTYIYSICDLDNDCDTALVTITIAPSTLSITCNLGANVTCNGGSNGSASVSVSGGFAPYIYAWSNGGTTSSVSGLIAGTYIVTVTDNVLVSRVCSLTVSQPTAILITENNIVNNTCGGTNNGSIDIEVSGGTSPYVYAWTMDGNPGFNSSTQDLSGLSGGTYYVKVTDASLCEGFDTITLVDPSTLAATIISTTNLACTDVNSGSIDLGVTGGTSPYTYAWTKVGDIMFNRSTQDIYNLEVGTYNVTITDATSCSATSTATLTSGSINAAFTAQQLDCDGNYQLINNSTGADDYVWNIQGISPTGLNHSIYCTSSDTVIVYAFAPGTYQITLTANNNAGCVDSAMQILTIIPRPIAIFAFESVACTNEVQFTNMTINGVGSNWNFGDPTSGINNESTLDNPNHVFTAGGTFAVTLIANDGAGCADTLTRNIPVNSVGTLPVAGFTSAVETGSCVTKVHFTNTSTNAATYMWIFPDGSSNNQENPSKTFPLAGTYIIKLIAISASGCTDTVEHNVVINSNTYGAVAKFVASDSVMCFNNNRFNFVNQSLYYGSGWISDYLWDFGDGTQDFTNTFVYDKVYAAPGTYTVRLIGLSPSGCSDTAYQTIRVKPSADPTFVMTIGCGKTAYLEHAVDTNVTYVWNFGDGNYASNTLDSFAHTYANPGYYNIQLTTYMDNGCTDTYSIGTLASDGRIPTANFSYYQACGNNIQFNNLSVWGSSFLWNFGDGSPIDSTYEPYHSFPAAGTYNVSLTVYNSPTCIHTFTMPVVAPQGWNIKLPRAKMAFHVEACTNVIMARDSASIDATQFKWYINGAYVSTGSNVSIPTSTAGIYELWMIADNGYCSDTSIAGIHIQDAPIAGFDINSNSCSSTIMVSSNSQNANSYVWEFGELGSDQNTAYGSTASHTYASNGTYQVRLIVFNLAGCADTITQSVTVTNANAANLANFTYNNALCNCRCQNTVRFKNLTGGAGNAYLWTFGDGNTSVQTSPSKGYAAAGTYQVTLTAVDPSGCMSTKTKEVTIDAAVNGPSASFSTDYQVQCEDSNSFNFYNTTTYMGSGWVNKYYWYFGDGTMDTTNTFVYNKHYSAPGNYIVTLVAVSAEGCRDTMSMYVQVRPMPCSGVLKFVNMQDGSNWQVDPRLIGGDILNSVNTLDVNLTYSMYPNPNDGNFSIEFKEILHEKMYVKVVDIYGKEVYSRVMSALGSKSLDFEISDLAEGTYMLMLQSDSHKYSAKKFTVIHN
ncbi:MAG: PKD domain-containing protein, partial [Bacteroidia bacterium]|nr:PKD domain-containing protein [Bacteroidia bacterium]MCF8448198.1 PKD domain-containing protein [Bacteroidia bacterium]